MAHIDDLIFDARFFAAQVLASAGSAMDSAMATINSIGVRPLPDDIPDLSAISPPTPPSALKIPSYEGSYFTPLDLSVIGSIPTPAGIGNLVIPPEPGRPPAVATYHAPNPPTMVAPNPSNIGPMPNLDIDAVVADIPEAPELQEKVDAIPVPPISDITLPPAPELILPIFVPGTPADPGPPPTDLGDQLREQFENISPIMRATLRSEFDAWIDYYYPTLRSGVAAMEAKLDEFLQGGTGLTPAVEDALYQRAVDKGGAEMARARDTSYAEAAKIGFTLAGPAQFQQAKEIDQSYRDNLARTASDIMVKNAELEQQNIQFALTLRNNASNAHMTAAVAYHGQLVQINGQSVQYAIAVVEQIVKVYNLAVEYAKVQIALEEARIHLYETQLKAALAVIEFYKAQIEGELAKVAVDKARVELYQAQLNALLIQANVYKTQMEGAALRANIEKLKVDLYGEQVKAFAAQVGAYSASWSGYEAAVRGETAAVNASVEQIRGYSVASENWRTIVQGRTAEIDAKQRLNESYIKIFGEQVAAFRGLNQASAESVRAEHESYDAQLRTLMAEQQTRGDYYRSQVSYYDMARRAMLDTIQIMLEEFREANKVAITKATAISQLAAAIGHDFAATSQAALSGLNTLAGEVRTTTAPAA